MRHIPSTVTNDRAGVSARRLALRWPLAAAALLAASALAPIAHAQDWEPTKPIKLIVALAPGGTADALARLIAQGLTESLGQSVVVENRSGGNTVIGTEAVVRAAPDGHTMGMITTPFASNATLVAKLPYDAARDVQPLMLIGRSELVLVKHPSVPANSAMDLVQAARTKALSFGSGGDGTASFVAGELFKQRTKGDFSSISYRGGGPAMADLAGNHIQFMFNAVPSTLPNIKGGKFTALATTGPTRSKSLPDVPTMAEAGFRDFEISEFFGLILPAGVSSQVIDRLQKDLRQLMQRPDFKSRTEEMGLELSPMNAGEFGQYLDKETKRIREVLKASRITQN